MGKPLRGRWGPRAWGVFEAAPDLPIGDRCVEGRHLHFAGVGVVVHDLVAEGAAGDVGGSEGGHGVVEATRNAPHVLCVGIALEGLGQFEFVLDSVDSGRD
ncbi:hypothetical protein BLIN9172_03557, partial [Brevibacterium linens ATCC 9172]